MKAATGELNLTVITIIAIAAVIAFFWMMWPQIQKTINNHGCDPTISPEQLQTIKGDLGWREGLAQPYSKRA